jgi:hypothetical protein
MQRRIEACARRLDDFKQIAHRPGAALGCAA